jgi:hypothetical protein
MSTRKGEHIALHGSDIQQISSVTTRAQIDDNERTRLYRRNRWDIVMCSISFELLSSFLQDNEVCVNRITDTIHLSIYLYAITFVSQRLIDCINCIVGAMATVLSDSEYLESIHIGSSLFRSTTIEQ